MIMLITSFVFMACEKNDENSIMENGPNKQSFLRGDGIMEFHDQNEFAQFILNIDQMDRSQLSDFADGNDYQSFGLYCDDLYFQIAADSLKPDLVSDAVDSYNEYIMLEPDDSIEGDFVFKARFQDHPLYYIINLKYMYIVGEYVYKLFDEGIIETKVDFIDELTSVGSYDEPLDQETFSKLDNEVLDTDPLPPPHDAGIKVVKRKTNGKKRTKSRIKVHLLSKSTAQYASDHLVRPYKKTLGIWYWCKRTITYDFNTAVDVHHNNGNCDVHPFNVSGQQKRYSIQKRDVFWGPPVIDTESVHYRGYDCMGDTPDTDPVDYSKYTFNL